MNIPQPLNPNPHISVRPAPKVPVIKQEQPNPDVIVIKTEYEPEIVCIKREIEIID